MSTLVSILTFIGLFLALTFLIGQFGWLGVWELALIAIVAAVVTFAIARRGRRRAAPNATS